jgi:hypothetical protein
LLLAVAGFVVAAGFVATVEAGFVAATVGLAGADVAGFDTVVPVWVRATTGAGFGAEWTTGVERTGTGAGRETTGAGAGRDTARAGAGRDEELEPELDELELEELDELELLLLVLLA